MHAVIFPVFDNQQFFELKPYFAKNMITGFARLAGTVVGVVANQPKHLGGVIDIKGVCEILKDADIDSSTLEIIGSEDILKRSVNYLQANGL